MGGPAQLIWSKSRKRAAGKRNRVVMGLTSPEEKPRKGKSEEKDNRGPKDGKEHLQEKDFSAYRISSMT
jgi:hypothetical protein